MKVNPEKRFIRNKIGIYCFIDPLIVYLNQNMVCDGVF